MTSDDLYYSTVALALLVCEKALNVWNVDYLAWNRSGSNDFSKLMNLELWNKLSWKKFVQIRILMTVSSFFETFICSITSGAFFKKYFIVALDWFLWFSRFCRHQFWTKFDFGLLNWFGSKTFRWLCMRRKWLLTASFNFHFMFTRLIDILNLILWTVFYTIAMRPGDLFI